MDSMARLKHMRPKFAGFALFLPKIALWTAVCTSPISGAEIGSKLQNFRLKDVSGETKTLESYSGKIVVFVFWSFKCPVSLAYNERVEKLQAKYSARGIVVLGVASGSNDHAEEISANASNLKIQFPILLDPEGDLAEKLGATHTPDVFILDGKAALRYSGAFDNNQKLGEGGRIAYAEDAIDAILAGRAAPVSETRPFGCSIKRRNQ